MESTNQIIGLPSVNQSENVYKCLHARNAGGDPLGGPRVSDACSVVASVGSTSIYTEATSAEIGKSDEGPIGQRCGRWVKLVCMHCGSPRRIYEACGDRLCCKWCRLTWVHETQRRFLPVFEAMYARGRCRFITLTLKGGFDLRERLNHIRKSWRKLSQRVLWKNAVIVGVKVLEITFDTCGWHVHFHILACGRYIPQAELSAAWYEATGDSYIVDIRASKSLERTKKELVKYTFKDVGVPADRVAELKRCLRGARLIEVIGANKELRKEMRGLRRKSEAPECEVCNHKAWAADIPLEFLTHNTVASTGPPIGRRVPVMATGLLFGEGRFYGG